MNRLREVNTAEQLISERLVGIDILRGLAVLFVVFVHTPHYAMGGFRQNPWFFPALLMDYGYLGVPLFVLISGFCIHRRAAIAEMKDGQAKLNWIEFWKRRFWRLYPPYAVAMVVSVMAAFWLHNKSPNILSAQPWDAFAHLCMVHNLTSNYAGGMGNGAFWSLGMEEQLYLLYFPMFLLIQGQRRRLAIAIAVGTTCVWRAITVAACSGDPSPILPGHFLGLGAWGLWPFSFWMHWALGALAVDAYFGNCRLPKWCSSLWAASLALGIGVATNRITFNFLSHTSLGPSIEGFASYVPRVSNLGEIVFAIGFFFLLNWCVSTPRDHLVLRNHLSGAMAWLGKISYSVYLIHIPVIFTLEYYLPLGHSPTDWIVRILVYCSLSLFAGAVFYWLVERWFLAGRCPIVLRAAH